MKSLPRGWRYLEPGEKFQKGDKVYNRFGGWTKIPEKYIGTAKAVRSEGFIRKVEQD